MTMNFVNIISGAQESPLDEYVSTLDRLFEERANARFTSVAEDEYETFREECLVAAKSGKSNYSTKILRDRRHCATRVLNVHSDCLLPDESREWLLSRMLARDTLFTYDEAFALAAELEDMLKRDGFSDDAFCVEVFDVADSFEEWVYCIRVHAFWTNENVCGAEAENEG